MRSRFKGSKRVRKSNSFERIQNSLKHFVQNIDKIAIAKTGFCLILLIVFYFQIMFMEFTLLKILSKKI